MTERVDILRTLQRMSESISDMLLLRLTEERDMEHGS